MELDNRMEDITSGQYRENAVRHQRRTVCRMWRQIEVRSSWKTIENVPRNNRRWGNQRRPPR
eukprot:326204-Lingulodinium_polyedra.AAC.1